MSRNGRVYLSERTSSRSILSCNDEKMLPPKFPVLKSKGRALANAINKDLNKTIIGKTALERQRENASKLASGRSVVDKSNKENEVARNKSVISAKPVKPTPQSQIDIKLNKSRNVLEEKKNKLIKSASVTSLCVKEEVKKVVPQVNVQVPAVPKVEVIKSVGQRTEVLKPVAKTEVIKPEIKDKPKVEAQIPPAVNVIYLEEEKHRNNEFLLGIYADDIHKFLKKLEAKQPIRKKYFTSSHFTSHAMRSLLVDWLFEVQQFFKLLNETIHLSIALLDLFLQDNPHILKDELQLVGIACVFLASKYEEMYPPDLMDLVEISANAYTKKQVIKMEQIIFSFLNFQMGRPTPSEFLRRYSRAADADVITYCLAKYFIDLSLLSYNLCHTPPSLMAASALYLSLHLLTEESEVKLWSPKLRYFSDYNQEDLLPIVRVLAAEVWHIPESRYQNVTKKYLEPKRMHCVSALKELKSEKLYKVVQGS